MSDDRPTKRGMDHFPTAARSMPSEHPLKEAVVADLVLFVPERHSTCALPPVEGGSREALKPDIEKYYVHGRGRRGEGEGGPGGGRERVTGGGGRGEPRGGRRGGGARGRMTSALRSVDTVHSSTSSSVCIQSLAADVRLCP